MISLEILPVIGVFAQIVIGLFALLAIGIIIIAYYCFDDNDPDMFFHDNYQNMTHEHYAECHRPFIALKEVDCPHTGEKTNLVTSVAATCEEVHEVCDDCGEDLGKCLDC